jgi:hypothetical protein
VIQENIRTRPPAALLPSISAIVSMILMWKSRRDSSEGRDGGWGGSHHGQDDFVKEDLML